MSGSIPRQGVEQPPLSLFPLLPSQGVHTLTNPHAFMSCPWKCKLYSNSCTQSIPVVQGSLCVISHNMGEENTPKYLRTMKTYQNVLKPMGHQLDLEMCGQE